MFAMLMAVIAGAAMSFQGVMNTRLSDRIGLYEANVFVQATALVLSLAAMFILGKGSFHGLMQVNKLYLLGGVMGLIITLTVMLAIGGSSPTVAIAVILIAQLTVAALIDAFGLLGSEKVPFLWNKYLGLALMVGGVILFKIR